MSDYSEHTTALDLEIRAMRDALRERKWATADHHCACAMHHLARIHGFIGGAIRDSQRLPPQAETRIPAEAADPARVPESFADQLAKPTLRLMQEQEQRLAERDMASKLALAPSLAGLQTRSR